MRIRSTKPEFWSSADIAALSREHRLLFLGLWSYVDDNGVGRDDFRLINADLFPLDEPVESRAYVRDGLATLSRHGLIARYAVEGRSYIYITGWRHQRVDKPGKPRYPLPPEDWNPPPTCDDADSRDGLATLSRESPETLDTGRNRTPASATVFEPLGRSPERPSRDASEGSTCGSGESREISRDSRACNRGTGEQGRRTKSSSSSSSAAAAAAPAPPPRGDVEQLCTRLRDRIAENDLKAPSITAEWRKQARLLLDKDGRDLDQALRLIDWCQSDTFWRGNVLSLPKFRQQYDQLLAKARHEQQSRRRGRSRPAENGTDANIARLLGVGPPPALRAVEGGY